MKAILTAMEIKMAAISGRVILYCYRAFIFLCVNKKDYITKGDILARKREIIIVNRKDKKVFYCFETN